jgi:histidinol-phosphate aminotransferase
VANILNRVRQPFNVNSFALAAAAAVLSDAEYLEKGKRINKEGLEQVEEGLTALGLSYIPSVGNFICFEVKVSGDAIYHALLKKGVIVRPLANYGMPHQLRVSIGLKNENQQFLDALSSVL